MYDNVGLIEADASTESNEDTAVASESEAVRGGTEGSIIQSINTIPSAGAYSYCTTCYVCISRINY